MSPLMVHCQFNRGFEGNTGSCSLANTVPDCPSVPHISPDISLNISPALNSYTPKTVIRGPWPTAEKPIVQQEPVPLKKTFLTSTILGEPVTRERILQLLRSKQPQCVDDIFRALGAPKGAIKRALWLLESRQIITWVLSASPHARGSKYVRYYRIAE